MLLKQLTHFLIALLLAATVPLPLGSFQKAKLSQKQVTQLVAIGTPDEAIAQEIRDRGLDFEPTQKAIDDLHNRGAGLQTLTALNELMPLGTLEILTQPGCEVTVDGASRGTIDAQGVLVLRELVAGTHQVIVRKTDYQEGHFTVEIGNREYKHLPVQLAWSGGFLTVRAEPSASKISIEGLGEYNGGVSDIQSPPGTYSIRVTHAGMKPEHQNITVAAGQHAVADIHLDADPEFLMGQLAAGEAKLAGGDTAAAIQAANEVLTLDPNNSRARSLVAGGYFRAQDMPHFVSSFVEAIRGGGSVRMTLLHVHGGIMQKYLHPFTLMATADTLAYDRQISNGPCNMQSFVTSLRKVQSVEVRHSNGTVLLRLKLINPTASKAATLDFAAPGSSWDSPPGQIVLGPGGPPIVSPPSASQTLEAVAGVLRNAIEGAR